MAGTFSPHPDSAPGDSPFLPGSRMFPPDLAGRETEQALIRRLLTVIAKRSPLARATDVSSPNSTFRAEYEFSSIGCLLHVRP